MNQDIEQVLADHSLWLRNCGGVMADLRGRDLREYVFGAVYLDRADFRDADLSGASFQESHLTGADFRGANLWRANLSHTDLRGADLRGADLREANLAHANLSGARLEEARFDETDLTGCNLEGTGLSVFSAWWKTVYVSRPGIVQIMGSMWNLNEFHDRLRDRAFPPDIQAFFDAWYEPVIKGMLARL